MKKAKPKSMRSDKLSNVKLYEPKLKKKKEIAKDKSQHDRY